KHGPSRDGRREVTREPGRAHDHLEPPLERGPRVLIDQIRVARRRHDPHLVRDVELLEDQPRLAEDRELGRRGGEHPDERRGLLHIDHARAPSTACAAMSVRNCMPSKWISATPRYARSLASEIELPS